MPDLPLPLNYRSEVISPLVRQVREGNLCALIGVGSVGKGNVVRHLRRADVREHYFQAQAPQTLYLYVDCQDLNGYGEQQVYGEILNVMCKRVRDLGDAGVALQPQLAAWWREAVTPGNEPFVRPNLENALEAVLEGTLRRMIVVLDDCDALVAACDAALLRGLRALRDDYKQQLVYVTVSRRELARLRPPSPDLQTFFEPFAAHLIGVKPYREADAIFMLERLAARQEVYPRPLSDAEIHRLVEITGGHAGLLKQAYEATRHGARALEPNLLTILLSKRLIWAECEKIWESLEDYESADLQAVALGQTPRGAGIPPLKVKGLLLENLEQQFSIFCRLFAEFVKAKVGAPPPPPGPDIALDQSSHTVTVDGRTVLLTPVEHELFRLLYERRPEPCGYPELVNRLMAVEPGGNPHRRLEQYMNQLRSKIDLPGKSYILSTPDHGWQLLHPSPSAASDSFAR